MEALSIPVPLAELLKRTVRETVDDDCLSLAAQLAYYFFLALFPAILFVLAIASFFPLQNLTDDLRSVLGPFVSPTVITVIQEQMQRLAESDSGGILTFGVLGAIWSSSAALVSIVSSVNTAYDITEARPWWKVRLVAIGLTVALAVFVLTSLSLILAGPSIATWLGRSVGFGVAFEWTWKILQWPIAFALVSTALGLVYYYGPDAEQDWVWVSPGACMGALVWFISSLAFKFYIERFTDYNASYGAVGSIIVLLLWFYVSGLAILVGAEMNAEIEHASPHGKAPGEKVATGRKKMIGVRAARAFRARRESAVAAASSTPVIETSPTPSPRPRALGAALAFGIIAARTVKGHLPDGSRLDPPVAALAGETRHG